MTTKILVTYASRSGSTEEVAILPMDDVGDLSTYQAVVAGSAIRGSKWLPEGVQFIEQHRSALAQKRFAMFTVCITMAMKNAGRYRSAVSSWTAPVRSLVRPLSEGLFPGRLDFAKMPFNRETLLFRISIALGLLPGGDQRDWEAVRSWAEALKPVLA